jgi:parallel beta-helix repeat protein
MSLKIGLEREIEERTRRMNVTSQRTLVVGVLAGAFALALALVAGVGSAGADSSVVGPGESIQKAVNAADPGDTIVVRGVHREDVFIRKNGIKLRGDDAVIEAPTRAKADSPCSKFVGGPEAICVLGDFSPEPFKVNEYVKDVSVSGFTIRGFKDKDAFVIDVCAARNATVVGNRITGNVANGIGFCGSVNTTIANNHVIGSPEPPEHGILVDNDSRNTKIVNNVVRSYVFGIEVDKTTNTTIAGNDSIGNSVTGIGVLESLDTKILSNVARRNEVVGVYVEDLLGGQKSRNAKVVGNNISGSAWGLYVGDTKRGSFAGNTIHDNCAGMFFESYEDNGLRLVGDFEVKGNTVENNTRSCRAAQFDKNFSGIEIALLGASGMEVSANHLSGNVPSGPTAVSGGVVVSTDPFFGETIKPRNNTVTGNHFGRNKPDIFWDKSGSGNSFVGNLCDTSVPSSLCN